VVGVMPPQFDMPAGSTLWQPFTIDEDFRERGGRFLAGVARLAPQASVATARAEMALIARNLERERPAKNTGWGVTVTPLQDDLVTAVRPQLLILMVGVAVLLVMACVNVAGLMLSRSLTRHARVRDPQRARGRARAPAAAAPHREPRPRAIGGAAGLALGHWALGALTAALPAEIPSYMQPRMSGPVLAFTMTLCVVAALLTGVAPALRIGASPLLPALREGAAATGVGPARRRARGVLVAAQMAWPWCWWPAAASCSAATCASPASIPASTRAGSCPWTSPSGCDLPGGDAAALLPGGGRRPGLDARCGVRGGDELAALQRRLRDQLRGGRPPAAASGTAAGRPRALRDPRPFPHPGHPRARRPRLHEGGRSRSARRW
jgi:hypothetical protein